MQMNILAGGEAGQGIQTIGLVLSSTLARGGLNVFADQEYESRIKGGHSYFKVRAADNPIAALADEVDILVALNSDAVDLHRNRIRPGGALIYDSRTVTVEATGTFLIDIPLEKMAVEIGSDKLMANSVATGAVLGLLKYDFELLAGVIRKTLDKAGNDIVERNLKAARAGFDFTLGLQPERPPLPVLPGHPRMLLNGNEALSLGAMAAGMTFLAGYPMTPTTSILELINEAASEYGIIAVQTEDEISAINMVIGASYAGARAMTATSGSGFCLMTEALGLAGMTETPAVVVLGQRPGPAIGLPTCTEQGDLLFACFAGTGEFPRAVLAPTTIEDCFWMAAHAFNLADRHHALAIILTDHLLASSYQTVGRFDLARVKVDRGTLFSEKDSAADYMRYLVTESGVSPRAFPMQGEALVVADSDEHNQAGHIDEGAGNRSAQVAKRLRKSDGLKEEILSPYHDETPGVQATLVGWGSTHGAIGEAVSMLRNEGSAVNHLHLGQVWPFPASAVAAALGGKEHVYVVENNATGQMARLIKAETGITVSGGINKFDGRPFSPKEIAEEVRRRVEFS